MGLELAGAGVNTQRARKRHACDGCPQPIEVGQEYKRIIWNKSDDVEKYHIACYEDEFVLEEV
jgi:hypothetical protein